MTPTFAAARLRARLLRHHLPLALGCMLATGGLVVVVGGENLLFRWSMATAYVALALLAATLAIGPLYALRQKRLPTSFDLRRDLGIWTALVAVAHTGVGAFVHMTSPLLYVFRPGPYPDRLVLRADPFGAANYAGIAAVLIALALLVTSNDLAIRRLGVRRWKGGQRFAYCLGGLIVGHGAIYQVLEERKGVYVALFLGLALTTVALQLCGVAARRRQRSRTPT